MTLIENEQEAQRQAQNKMLDNERLKIYGATIVAILSIISAGFFAWLGYPLPGIAVGLGGALLHTIRFMSRRLLNGQG